MGEGVSLSLPRNGFSDLFSRENRFSGGINLPESHGSSGSLETDLAGVFPSRSKGEDRPTVGESSIRGGLTSCCIPSQKGVSLSTYETLKASTKVTEAGSEWISDVGFSNSAVRGECITGIWYRRSASASRTGAWPKSGEPDHGVSVLMGLITTGSGFIYPDPVESDNGNRPEGSHGTVKMPTSPHGTVKDDKVSTALCGFAHGPALPALIMGNFAGRFMGFQLNEVAEVVGTSRKAGCHKPILPTPMNGYFDLILGSDPSATVLTGFELPKSWTLELFNHSDPTMSPAMMTRSLVQISAGSALAPHIRFQIFIGGRVSHGNARAPVNDKARFTEFGRLRRMGRDAAGVQVLQRRSLGRLGSRLAIERSDGNGRRGLSLCTPERVSRR